MTFDVSTSSLEDNFVCKGIFFLVALSNAAFSASAIVSVGLIQNTGCDAVFSYQVHKRFICTWIFPQQLSLRAPGLLDEFRGADGGLCGGAFVLP